MGFSRPRPQDPGRTHQAPEYTDDEISEVIAALSADEPDLLAMLEREARTPGSVAMADYDDVYDRMLTYLFEHGFVHTHVEMAMVFRAVRERMETAR
ncbi:hypothetical protein CA606_14900 [Caulobacter vibrioides]|uniref:Uncharacterized protein n=1 Tax=Caulobacter vibrioides TaxID=155892 RepID=A0A290MNC3_CAUVI|nr:hypothetical protein [Caulobacter vibrioides]ATC33511.1 hypothetical protein CA606_14900 [Caulobacter vibrioides]